MNKFWLSYISFPAVISGVSLRYTLLLTAAGATRSVSQGSSPSITTNRDEAKKMRKMWTDLFNSFQ